MNWIIRPQTLFVLFTIYTIASLIALSDPLIRMYLFDLGFEWNVYYFPYLSILFVTALLGWIVTIKKESRWRTVSICLTLFSITVICLLLIPYFIFWPLAINATSRAVVIFVPYICCLTCWLAVNFSKKQKLKRN